MMRADALNCHNYGGYTEMTTPSSIVYYTDEDESKGIIVHETLSQNCSANRDESKQSIVNESLYQHYSMDMEKLCSTEIDKSQYIITKKRQRE